MLRLAPPGFERFLQIAAVRRHLRRRRGQRGRRAGRSSACRPRYVTVLPRQPASRDAFVGELRRFGVDTSHIVRGKGRLGVYFVEPGANQRPSKVVYDRENCAIALAKPGDIDWDEAFDGAGWFHVTGITPAISAARGRPGAGSRPQGARDGPHRLLRPELPQEPVEVRQDRRGGHARAGQATSMSASPTKRTARRRWASRSDVDVDSGKLERDKYWQLTEKVLDAVPQPEGHRHHAARIEERLAQRLVGLPERPQGVPAQPPLRHHPHRGPRGRRRRLRRRPDLRPAGAGQRTRRRSSSPWPASCLKHSIPGDFNRFTRGRSEGAAQGRRLRPGAAVAGNAAAVRGVGNRNEVIGNSHRAGAAAPLASPLAPHASSRPSCSWRRPARPAAAHQHQGPGERGHRAGHRHRRQGPLRLQPGSQGFPHLRPGQGAEASSSSAATATSPWWSASCST